MVNDGFFYQLLETCRDNGGLVCVHAENKDMIDLLVARYKAEGKLSPWWHYMTKPRVLIIDEPTKGVDVGARMSVYQIINELTKAGIGIVMLTSDMMELIGLSDRILVFYEGKIVREIAGREATELEIME